MAIDSQPAEPFLARNGALVLAPGSRVDAFVDVTAPPGRPHRSCSTTARRRARSASSSSPASRRSRAAPLPPPPPLPSNGLPAQLDLKNALRVDLALGGRRATG